MRVLRVEGGVWHHLRGDRDIWSFFVSLQSIPILPLRSMVGDGWCLWSGSVGRYTVWLWTWTVKV
jgi:hypothetical protein